MDMTGNLSKILLEKSRRVTSTKTTRGVSEKVTTLYKVMTYTFSMAITK